VVSDALAWMEASTLGVAMRGTGVWTYAVVNLFHILGVSALFGSILILDLNLIGLWRRAPLAALARTTVPIAKAGFVVAALTGIGLISTNGTEYIDNPFLLIKFPAIAVGLVNVWAIGQTAGWRARDTREPTAREARQLTFLGGLSLVSWLTAIVAGRMIGYW
jgi:hypothetical protein